MSYDFPIVPNAGNRVVELINEAGQQSGGKNLPRPTDKKVPKQKNVVAGKKGKRARARESKE